MKKNRLDLLLTELNLVETRSLAQRLIMAGHVRVDDQIVFKPATMVASDATITIDQGKKFVSRGGEKLEAALEEFRLKDLDKKICADVGASTGGFTDCLLSHGAKKVYAIDVGQGILHWKLRRDPRVVSFEKTNVRHLKMLPEKVDVITIDVSFISLTKVTPVVVNWLKNESGIVVALIKPQFEAGRTEAARGKGVIRDTLVHSQILNRVLDQLAAEQFEIRGLMKSPLLGPKGNMEFLVYLGYPGVNTMNIVSSVHEILYNEENE